MIIYLDILQKLANKGWTAYKLRKEGIIGEATMTRIRKGEPIKTDTIDKICGLLNCQPCDLLKWEKDE